MRVFEVRGSEVRGGLLYTFRALAMNGGSGRIANNRVLSVNSINKLLSMNWMNGLPTGR